MTTNLRKSFFSMALAMTGAVFLCLLIASCSDGKGDGVWIPIPNDTSELGHRDHFISQKEIAVYRGRYDVERDTIGKRVPKLFLPNSEAFNKKSVLEILKDSNCIGIRIYYGATSVLKEKSDFRFIIVGVDKLGNDLYVTKGSPGAAQLGDGDKYGLEYGQCAPPCYVPPPPPGPGAPSSAN
jgi:hypothetical protein